MSNDTIFQGITIKDKDLPFDNNKKIQDSKDNVITDLKNISKEVEEISNGVDGRGYIPINNLCTKGKLTIPETIHVRNVNIEDLLDLSEDDEILQTEAVIKVLERITKEGLDGYMFSEEEVIQIFLTIYANFYSNTLQDYPYTLDEEEESILKEKNHNLYETYKKGDNPYFVDIDIKNIEFKELPEQFKEPINLTDKNGFKVSFRLPRIGDVLVVKKYIKKLFKKDDEKYYTVLQKLLREEESQKIDSSISIEEREDVENYLKNKTKNYGKVLLSLLLEKVGSKTLVNLEDKINNVHKIPIPLWSKINKIMENDLDYGVRSEVSITSPITGKSTIRRFSFRPMEILQSFKQERNYEVNLNFG